MTELLTLLSSGQTATTTGQGGNDIVSILTMLIPLALMVVIRSVARRCRKCSTTLRLLTK